MVGFLLAFKLILSLTLLFSGIVLILSRLSKKILPEIRSRIPFIGAVGALKVTIGILLILSIYFLIEWKTILISIFLLLIYIGLLVFCISGLKSGKKKKVLKTILLILILFCLNIFFWNKRVDFKLSNGFYLLHALQNTSMFEDVIPRETVEVWENGMRTDGKEGSFEWWYFDAILDDGTKIVVKFHARGLLDNPYVTVDIDWPNGEKYSDTYRFKEKDLSASKEMCDVKIGNNVIKGDLSNYDIHTKSKDLELNLHLESVTPTWRPGVDGAAVLKGFFFSKNKKYYAWLLAVPHGNVTGNITYKGEKKEASGTGYHDHNWGNMPVREFLSRVKEWYWVRAKFDDYVIVAASNTYRKSFGRKNYEIFYIAKGNEVLVNNWSNIHVSKRNKEVNPETGNKMYNELIFSYQDENTKAKLSLKRDVSLAVYDSPGDIERLNSNSIYHRITGLGTFEIERDGKKEKFESESIWEIMQVGR